MKDMDGARHNDYDALTMNAFAWCALMRPWASGSVAATCRCFMHVDRMRRCTPVDGLALLDVALRSRCAKSHPQAQEDFLRLVVIPMNSRSRSLHFARRRAMDALIRARAMNSLAVGLLAWSRDAVARRGQP